MFETNGATEVAIKLHESTACNGTLLNECRYLFDYFELPTPSKVSINAPTSISTNASTKHDIIQLECHCAVNSEVLVQKPKHFTDTLVTQHATHLHLSAFEYFYQRADNTL